MSRDRLSKMKRSAGGDVDDDDNDDVLEDENDKGNKVTV